MVSLSCETHSDASFGEHAFERSQKRNLFAQKTHPIAS